MEKQEQALQHTETQRNNADDITTDVTIMNSMHNNDFVRLRTIMTEIRRKDSALARLQHVLKGVQAHIIDKVYRSQLGALHAMLSNIDVVDEGALGGTKMELLSGGINWTEEVVSSLDTLPPLPPRSNVPIGGPSAVPESDEIDEASKVIGIQGNNERMNDGEAVLGPGCDPATPSRKTLTGMVTGSKFPGSGKKIYPNDKPDETVEIATEEAVEDGKSSEENLLLAELRQVKQELVEIKTNTKNAEVDPTSRSQGNSCTIV